MSRKLLSISRDKIFSHLTIYKKTNTIKGWESKVGYLNKMLFLDWVGGVVNPMYGEQQMGERPLTSPLSEWTSDQICHHHRKPFRLNILLPQLYCCCFFSCPSSSIPTIEIHWFIYYVEFWHNLFHFSLTYLNNLNNLNNIFYNSDFK